MGGGSYLFVFLFRKKKLHKKNKKKYDLDHREHEAFYKLPAKQIKAQALRNASTLNVRPQTPIKEDSWVTPRTEIDRDTPRSHRTIEMGTRAGASVGAIRADFSQNPSNELSSSSDPDHEKGWSDSDDDFIEDAGHKTPRTLKDGSAVEKTVIVRVKPRPASAPRTRQRGHLPPLKNIHEEPAWKKSQYLE